jgi:hypothetical protein
LILSNFIQHVRLADSPHQDVPHLEDSYGIGLVPAEDGKQKFYEFLDNPHENVTHLLFRFCKEISLEKENALQVHDMPEQHLPLWLAELKRSQLFCPDLVPAVVVIIFCYKFVDLPEETIVGQFYFVD